ncbi:hypothetical protein DYB28_006866 [Aphanomyces astaci]|uniref:Uncharacterized protein n=1 Tax=Aphanomyces astaci TaxID=112090 RepID=A0A9X8DV82_APHAT|nr:hypothetical protein DYB28_006866 [Aphanomyces astaci]
MRTQDVDVLPAKVKLYLARKQGEWLRGGYDLEAFLQSGVSSEYPKMLPLWKLAMPELFGSNLEPAVNVIHVLVALPSEPPSKKAKVVSSGVGLGGSIVGTNHYQPPQATWKPDVPPAFCLLNDDMFFVDRDDAVKQLQEIHRHTYSRAVRGRGLDWVIPLADNVVGLGKSLLGDQYVQRCREAWKDLDKPTDFHKTLMRCHTVRLVFKSGALVESSFDAVLIHLLVRQLRDMFEVPPAILSTPPPSAVAFLELLTDEVGPLFIALDEIGAAFTCDSWTDLKSRDLENQALFVGELRKYKKVVTEMLTAIKCGESTNLTAQVKDPGGKLISLDQIASNCCIAWQGTAEEATLLYAPPCIVNLLAQQLLPLRQYFLDSESNCSIDYATMFEWICLKRFQEMFHNALWRYFQSTSPKRLVDSSTWSSLTTPGHFRSAWPQLLEEIRRFMVGNAMPSVSFKPLPQSPSSDAFVVVETDDVLLTLGLAVKNYSTAKVSQGTLASECDKFNRMFEGCAAEPKRLNVLVVCATKYDKGFSDEFGNRKAMVAPSDAYPNIAQVILLNLSTPDNRAEFFCLNDAPDLASMLEKRIATGEVEFNNLVQRTSSASAEFGRVVNGHLVESTCNGMFDATARHGAAGSVRVRTNPPPAYTLFLKDEAKTRKKKTVNRMLQALRSGPTSCSKANQEPSANDASSEEDGTRDDDDDGDLVTQRHYWDEGVGDLENEVEIQV